MVPPNSQEGIALLPRFADDFVQFFGRISQINSYRKIIKPNFRFVTVFGDMNMGGLEPIG